MFALPALLQLASPGLPIGAFSYSSGLETAIDLAWVKNAEQVQEWIHAQLRDTILRWEVPLWRDLYLAWESPNDEIKRLNTLAIAARETAELRSEHTQMGHALKRWVLTVPEELSEVQKGVLLALEPLSVLTAHALAARTLGLSVAEGGMAFVFGVLENQITAAAKTLPLGQTAAQKMLRTISKNLSTLVLDALQCAHTERSSLAPMAVIASMRHETQYTRLFRS